ncbi:AAEL001911-PA [Aedes aegypti]|uniref:AAEL001911-PA n=2 Tax=Aedes aegypti TaxID=7159 RepID=A0A1S4F046_AEDAE|nr:uncharacterized protein LOC5572788 [Aedes aegypti]EAT46943.1 AAEL001911-PA [Aedes aegypti]
MIPCVVPPLKYKWTKAYLLRPIDNIISHPDALRKRPFRPSFESHGAPSLPCLLRYDYFRIWKYEHSNFQACKCAMAKAPKKKYSPYRKKPIRGTYCGTGCGQKAAQKPRFIMKKFCSVACKVDCHRPQIPILAAGCC